MPNWCSNWIVISGDKKKINIIKSALENLEDKNKSNVFETLIGTNPSLTLEEYEKNWYQSNMDRYGTKWDVSYNECQPRYDDENTIVIMPETAWSPPIEFCRNLCKMYGVSVQIEYEEAGCDFAGSTKIDNEGLISEENDYSFMEGTYRLNPEQFWSLVESDLHYKLSENSNYTIDDYIKEYDVTYISESDQKELHRFFDDVKSNIIN